ncbi:ABC transporter ATP-binding protein [Streptomyces rochei]
MVRPLRVRFVCAAAMAWCSTAAGLALPWLISEVLTALVRGTPTGGPVVWLTAVTLVSFATQAACGRLLAQVGEALALNVRTRVTHHVLRLPMSEVRSHGVGDISARITHDTTLVRTSVECGVVHLPAAVFGVLSVLITMVCLDVQLTFLTIGAFTLVGGPLTRVLARTRGAVSAQQTAGARLSQRLHMCLDSLATVKAYRYEARAAEGVEEAAASLGTAAVKVARSQSLIGPLVGLAQQAALLAVTVTAVHRIDAGTLSLTTFSVFFFLLLCLTSPVTVVALGIGQRRAGQAARARLEHLLALPVESQVPSPSAHSERRVRARTAGAVTFDRVTFSHPGDEPVFRDLSFTVPEAGLTVLVGPSGAGKSTVLALINRLLRADQGDIRVLGREVGSWPLPLLRGRLAYVEQRDAVWEGTVRENLCMGCTRDPGEDALWDALRAVALDETVKRLPEGLDTPLGGQRLLSGGQNQRLGLARALLTDADLFLLDEPTSQLDPATEHHVLDALRRLADTRPVLMATHRPQVVADASRVITVPRPSPFSDGSNERVRRLGAEVGFRKSESAGR